MQAVFLSPHFDDAALSCGALIHAWSAAGRRLVIYTVCAADPPPGPLAPFAASLHERWATGRDAASQRREEDWRACQRLGVSCQYGDLPDCIYRRLPGSSQPLIQAESDLFMPLPDGEYPTVQALADALASTLPAGSLLAAPLAVGGHVDHRLVRLAAETLAASRSDLTLRYFPDYPYIEKYPYELQRLAEAGWQAEDADLPPASIQAWVEAVAEYRSQISTFWQNEAEMARTIQAYAASGGGRLWCPPAKTAST